MGLTAAAQAREEATEVAVPRAAAAARVDGVLDDACWRSAARITGFATPGKFAEPGKQVSVLLTYDDRALYLAARCAEPQPAQVKVLAQEGMHRVWQDDCLEIFLRTGDSALDVDHFVASSTGVKQAERVRAGRYEPDLAPTWEAAGRVGEADWSVQAAIPFAALETAAPAPGQMLQLALGREDYTGP